MRLLKQLLNINQTDQQYRYAMNLKFIYLKKKSLCGVFIHIM